MNRIIHRRILPALESLVFSFTLITVTAGMKIINPKNVSWLQDGDGTAELSWEFFRRQSLFQFPIGKNPNYGLEISNSIAFDGAIPLMSLILRPFSFLMGDRFQYFGIFLFVTFALNYLIAKKIFTYLEFNYLNSSFSAIIVSLSPIILNRYIDNTHYSLTAAFLIFFGIFLVLKNDLSLSKWNILFALCILIHFYFVLFIFTLYVVFLLASLIRKKQTVAKMFINLLIILGTNTTIMYVVGYFYGGVSSSDVGYGLFRSTLLSLIDPSGWSIILPDLGEPDGAYEGFSFLGFSTIFLLIILLVAKLNTNMNVVKNVDFAAIWVTSIILFIFSLSNKISFGKRELIEFKVPELILNIFNSFRSSGRFSWLLVFAILFWVLIKLNSYLKPKNLSILLLISLIIGIVDAGPQLLSQRYEKFSNQYKNNLTNMAWSEIGECYKKIRVYPPVPSVDNYYNFVNLANKLDLGINTGRFSRVNVNSLNDAYTKMHNDFIFGNLEKDSLYVFTTAPYSIPEVIDFRKNIALFGLNDFTKSGKLNNFTVIAPDILQCKAGLNLKNNLKNLGVQKGKKYNLNDQLEFGLNQDSSRYILSGFSALQDWGVWTVGESSDLIIHLNSEDIPNKILIEGKIQSKINNSDTIGVEVNNIEIGKCKFELTLSSCVLEFKNLLNGTGPVQIRFIPENPISSKALNLSDETIPYGLGLISVQLARD
jgi:hypothetical protein